MKDVRIVVPTHQRRELVQRLAGSLVPRLEGPVSAELVVVCDGCTDGSASALRERFGAAIVVLEQPQRGPGAARNLGARGAEARLLLFLDDDMRADESLLARHAAAQAALGGGIVLGAIPVDPASPKSFLTEGLARWAIRRDERLRTPGTSPGFDEVLTGNLSLPRDLFERLGGFDAELTDGERFGDEDLELGWRAIEAGARVAYAPDAVAWQTFDKTFRTVASDVRRGAAGDLRFAEKHPAARERLTLGRIDALPPWERRALRFAAGRPALASPVVALGVTLLDLLARLGATGRKLEEMHAVVRAGCYGLGVGTSS